MRRSIIRTVAVLTIVAVIVGAALAGGLGKAPLDAGGDAVGSGGSLTLNDGGQFLFWSFGPAQAANIFTTVKIAWLFDGTAVVWTSFVPALGTVNFALVDGAVLWVVSEGAQTIAVVGGSAPSDDPITGTLEAGAGPDDPLISRFIPTGGSFGDITSIELFGPHSDDASFTESANIFVAGEADPITISFNEDGWPVSFQAPDGTTIEVIYGATTAEVHYLLPSGDFGVETVPLSAEVIAVLEDLREDAAINRDALGVAAASHELEASQEDLNRVVTYMLEIAVVDASDPDVLIGGARVSAEVNGFQPDTKHLVNDLPAHLTLTWSINTDQELARTNRQLQCERTAADRSTRQNLLAVGTMTLGTLAGSFFGPWGAQLGTAVGGALAGGRGASGPEIQAACDESPVLGPPLTAGSTVTIRVTHPHYNPGVQSFTINPLELPPATSAVLRFELGEAFGQFCPTAEGLHTSGNGPTFDPDSNFAPPGFPCPTTDEDEPEEEDTPAPMGQPIIITERGAVSASSTFDDDPAFAPEFAVDDDDQTSWFSAGPGPDGTSVFTWTGERDFHISFVTIIGNLFHATEAFQEGCYFGRVEVRLETLDGEILASQERTRATDQPTSSFGFVAFGDVLARRVVLIFSEHEAPNCGGFSEVIIRGFEP